MFWSQCDYLSKAKKHFCGKGRQRKVMMDAAVYKCILQPASGKVQENMLSSYIFLNWIYFIKYTSCIYIVVFCQKPTVQEGKNSMKLQCCVVFNSEGSSILWQSIYMCCITMTVWRLLLKLNFVTHLRHRLVLKTHEGIPCSYYNFYIWLYIVGGHKI